MKETNLSPEVLVVGGGPAGMIAAGRAAELGANVLLLEKNDTLGKKLLITGGGRCNVTNAEPDTRKLLARFKGSDKFLFSAFSKWNVESTLTFFHSRGMATKIENEGRVFPVSDSAQSVWDVLVHYMKEGNVTIKSNTKVSKLLILNSAVQGVILESGEIIRARNVILATGGKSRPETGSTGDGFVMLKNLGHTVKEPSAALVPVATKEPWVKTVSGLTLSEVKISVYQNNIRQDQKKGKLLFTHVGLSGPTILNMSRDIGELLKYGEVILKIDLLPAAGDDVVNKNLTSLFQTESNKQVKNVLTTVIPSALVQPVLEQTEISGTTPCHSITRDMRLRLVRILKGLPLTVKNLLDEKKAIITSGGVSLSEIDFRTMESKLFPHLYIVGDLLNIDRPSGGYSLQLCWTTGFVAGSAVGETTS